MKFRFAIFYRLGLAMLLVTACWAVWANAQTETVTNSPGAHVNAKAIPDADGPTSTNGFQASFGWDRFEILKQYTFLDEPLWKYAASLTYILLAFVVAWLLDFIVNVWLKRLTAKADPRSDDLLLKLLRGPVKVVAFVILLNIGLGMFNWPLRAQLFLSRGLIVIVACSITYVAVKLVDLLLALWRGKIVAVEDRLLAEQLLPLLRKVIKAAIIVAAVVVTAENLEIKINSLLAGFSIGGLALGLAAQDTVANLFGAVAIFLDKPFHIGDLVKVEGVDGTVESIGLRSTRIRNLDGHHVTIPNKTMGNAIITNVTRRPTIKSEINIGLTYDTPAEKVRRAVALLEEIFRAHPKTADLIISFNKFADSSLNIMVVHFWKGTNVREQLAGLQELNLQIKARFDAEKIDMAFPTQTVYVKPGPGAKEAPDVAAAA